MRSVGFEAAACARTEATERRSTAATLKWAGPNPYAASTLFTGDSGMLVQPAGSDTQVAEARS